jgi:hypothetical protein
MIAAVEHDENMEHMLIEGWKQLLNARKAHYFVDGRSLCNRWMFLGTVTSYDSQTLGEAPQHSDCKGCWRAVKVRNKSASK